MSDAEGSAVSVDEGKCPFCGGTETATVDGDWDYAYIVQCQTCEASGPPGTTRDEAREKWNGRVDDPVPVGQPEPVEVCMVFMGDWEGMYIDGKLVAKAEYIFAMEALAALPGRCHLNVSSLAVEEDAFEGQLPEQLAEVQAAIAKSTRGD